MSTSSAATDAAVEAILAEFRLWLARERGLSAAAVCCYGKQARKFLSWLPDPVDSAVRQLDSTQVTSFMVSYCQDRNISSAKATVTAVRASLRYLHATGNLRSRPRPSRALPPRSGHGIVVTQPGGSVAGVRSLS